MGTGRPSLVRAYGFVRILAGIRVLLITVASRMPIAFAVTDSQPSLRVGRAQAAPYFFEGPVGLSNSSLSGSASTSSGPRGLQGWLNGSQARSDQAIGFFGQAHDNIAVGQHSRDAGFTDALRSRDAGQVLPLHHRAALL